MNKQQILTMLISAAIAMVSIVGTSIVAFITFSEFNKHSWPYNTACLLLFAVSALVTVGTFLLFTKSLENE